MEVDELLAMEETVPCTLLVEGVRFGALSGNDAKEVGSQIFLPLWLAKAMDEKNMVRIELPDVYKDNFRDALDIAANLRALGAHYYTVGSEVARARKDEDLRMKLRAAISGPRYEKIFDWSRSSTGSDASALLDNLTDEERALFQAGSDAHNAILDWKSRRATTRLGASDLFVAGGRGLG